MTHEGYTPHTHTQRICKLVCRANPPTPWTSQIFKPWLRLWPLSLSLSSRSAQPSLTLATSDPHRHQEERKRERERKKERERKRERERETEKEKERERERKTLRAWCKCSRPKVKPVAEGVRRTRAGNDSDFRGSLSHPTLLTLAAPRPANAELASPFMPCPWDYRINLRDLITTAGERRIKRCVSPFSFCASN